jgi:hypothetical protein
LAKKSNPPAAAGVTEVHGTREEQLAQILGRLHSLDPALIHGILVVVGTLQNAKSNHLSIVEYMAGDEATLKTLAASQLMTLDEMFPDPDDPQEKGTFH